MKKTHNKYAYISLVLGILAFFLMLIPGLNVLLTLGALFFGTKSMIIAKTYNVSGGTIYALAGVSLGLITMLKHIIVISNFSINIANAI